ncbi:uncharacterized protein [Coffea arabica]|uniref:RNase H type-1 domain-containing protein n=1 Tax=Coffea arabica TaxID=13443 RepID=A0ABM4UR35_COFAR
MAASPPKAVFKELEGIFANFLWGSGDNGPKHHWIRWKDLCVEREEGGVGLRLLEDIHRAFSIKLWWNFRSKSSLWASFMHAKFCRVVHPNLVFSEKGSEGWRRMGKVRALAERNIGWIIRSGNVNFCVSDHKVADFVHGGSWDVCKISQRVPPDIVAEIGQLHPPGGSLPDLMVWRPEPSGRFSLKTAFFLVRHHSRPTPLFKRIWQLGGPSRCSCCTSPEIETTEHVFCEGAMARFVWQFFGAPIWAGSERGEVREQKDCGGSSMPFDLLRGDTVVQDPVSGLSGTVRVVGPFLFGHIEVESGISHRLAEARALLFGVNLCLQRGIATFDVEMDSLTLVRILNRLAHCPWGIHTEVQQLMAVASYFPRILHCYHQANQVADMLANTRCQRARDEIYLAAAELPWLARGALFLDRLGMPSLRQFVIRKG